MKREKLELVNKWPKYTCHSTKLLTLSCFKLT